MEEWNELQSDVAFVFVKSDSCNEASMTVLDVSGLTSLQEMSVGSGCFRNVEEVLIEGLASLIKVVIGENSFTEKSGAFTLRNCSSVQELRIGNYSFAYYSILVIEEVPLLTEVVIPSNSFMNVNEVRLEGLSGLERVVIGENSFTKKKNGWGEDSDRHFYLKDCPKMKSLRVGRYSFSDYSVCEIENVDALEVIEMGELNSESFNFHSASLELNGLMKLKSLLIGKESFEKCDRVVFESLPVLTSIQMGWNAFKFNNDNAESVLIVRNLTQLRSLITTIESVVNDCFGYPRHIVFENLPSLSTVILQRAFQYSDDIEISNVFSSSYEKRESICSDNEWLQLDPTITHLTVNSNCLNDLTDLPLNRLIALKELVIGDNSLNRVNDVKLDRLNQLELVDIGSDSFKNSDNNGLYLSDLPLLKKVAIGSNSFINYDVLVVTHIPFLEELSVGNGCLKDVSSLDLNGMTDLKRVTIGSGSFSNKNGSFSVVNCPSLESVEIGASSMAEYSVLSVENAPSLGVLAIGPNAFKNADALRLNGLSKLEKVEISENSFSKKDGVFELKNCSKVNELVIGNGGMEHFERLEIDDVPSLERIAIGDDCVKNVDEVKLSGLPKLKDFEVGADSFTNKEGSLDLRNCSLVSVKVGNGSMSDFSSAVIDTTPLLETITVGDGCLRGVGSFLLSGLSALSRVLIGRNSFSQQNRRFLSTSSSVRALRTGSVSFSQYALFSIRDAPALQVLSIGDDSFVESSLELKSNRRVKGIMTRFGWAEVRRNWKKRL